MKPNKEENINRKFIVNNLHNIIGSSKKNINKIVNDIIYAMIEILLKENKLNITNFGKFVVKQKKKRIGRNPKTKEVFSISKRKVINFKSSLSLSKILNQV